MVLLSFSCLQESVSLLLDNRARLEVPKRVLLSISWAEVEINDFLMISIRLQHKRHGFGKP